MEQHKKLVWAVCGPLAVLALGYYVQPWFQSGSVLWLLIAAAIIAIPMTAYRDDWLPAVKVLLGLVAPDLLKIKAVIEPGNRLLAWYAEPRRELTSLEFRVSGLERSHGWRKWYKHPKLRGGVVVSSDGIQPGQSMKPYPFVYPSGSRWTVGTETVDLQPGVWRLVLEVRGKDGGAPVAQEKIRFRFDGENIET